MWIEVRAAATPYAQAFDITRSAAAYAATALAAYDPASVHAGAPASALAK